MPAKMRLQRYGKKGAPYYHIVIADGRAPRDGRFIEKIGTYNPLTRPAEINIDFDKAMEWLKNGAYPTETVRAILGYKGVLYRYHLAKGVAKGALTEEQAEAKFEEWKTQKDAKIAASKNALILESKDARKKRLAEEAKINHAKAEELAKKYAKAAAKAAGEEEAAEEAAEEATDTPAEETAETQE